MTACADPSLDDGARMVILALDVGVIHLAIAVATCNADYSGAAIREVMLVNTMTLGHTRVCRAACRLHHTGMAADRVAHVVQERQELFDVANTIVVERQPPGGLRDVEQVLVLMFRDKVNVMAPQTMHAFIGSSRNPYTVRKQLAIEYATRFVKDLREQFPGKTDDVADAICIAVTYVERTREACAQKRQRVHSHVLAAERGLDLNAYRYTGTWRLGGRGKHTTK